MRRIVLLTFATLAAFSPGPVHACTPAVRAEVLRRAVTLMPPSLARQLNRHVRALEAAALHGIAAEPAPISALEPGDADRRLQAEVERAVRLLDGRAPMSAVADAFGGIARLAADLSFALDIGPHDPRAPGIYASFCRYAEGRLPRIKMTFAGYADDDLARDDVPAFARRTGALARRDYQGIFRTYFPEGRKPAPEDFDDRSVVFASASLEVSLALTTTARAWLYTWNRAHGDLAGTPFLAPQQEKQP